MIGHLKRKEVVDDHQDTSHTHFIQICWFMIITFIFDVNIIDS